MRGWETVARGHTGAVVRRSPDGRVHAKTATAQLRAELVDEHERLQWLAHTELPVAEVLAWDDDGSTATLTTTTLPGVPLSDLPPEAVEAAASSLGSFLARLHGLDPDTCAFQRSLAITVPLARVNVDLGLVDTDDFDVERLGGQPEELYEVLLEQRPHAERLELRDLVVCHGDACLPNFLADPDSLQITGMVDLGRLGVADRHQDLALAVRSMSDPTLNPSYGSAAVDAMLAAYGRPVDTGRLDFYRLLDEFF